MSVEETTPAPNELIVVGPSSIQRDAKPAELQTFIPSSTKGGITELPLSELRWTPLFPSVSEFVTFEQDLITLPGVGAGADVGSP